MGRYSIKELEKISGIKAHTLRIWEQRYELFNPERTETNIRYYDDEDVRKLLQIQVLQQMGYKISKIVAMPEKEKIRLLSVSRNKELSGDDKELIFVNQLIEAGMRLDEPAFHKVLDEIIVEIGLKNAFQTIFYKVLIRVGMLWEIGEFSPAQEHFTSCLIRDRIIAETSKLEPGTGRTFILWLPESEEHEIGLLFINFLLRYFKHKVIYLGPRVPKQSLIDTIDQVQPEASFAFVITRKNTEDFKALSAEFTKTYPKIKFFWSGSAVKESGIQSHQNQFMIHSLDEFYTEVL